MDSLIDPKKVFEDCELALVIEIQTGMKILGLTGNLYM